MGIITQEYRGQQTDKNYTLIVPFGVTVMTMLAIGPGGKGGNAQGVGAKGGGGAGGTFARVNNIVVTPGEPLSIFVPGDNASSPGLATWVKRGSTVLVQAQAGQGGGNAAPGSLSGAAGLGSIASSIGDQLFPGGNGSAGIASSRTGAGGGGAGTNGAGGNTRALPNDGGLGTALYGSNGVNSTSSSTGSPGFGASNANLNGGGGGGGARGNSSSTVFTGGVGNRGLVIVIYGFGDAELAPSTAAHCDDFDGPDSADINGRTLDGCGGTPGPTYDRDDGFNPDPGDTLGVYSGKLRHPPGAFGSDTQYLVPGATCQDGARFYAEWPNYDTISTPEICTLIWEDDFSGPSGSLDGRVHSGGSLGTGTYHRTDNHATSSPSGAQLDGSGEVYCPDGLQIAAYQIDGLGALPSNYDIIIDVKRNDVAGHVGAVGVTARGKDIYPPPPDYHARKNFGLIFSTDRTLGGPDVHAFWTGWVGDSYSSNFGNVITGSTVTPPGDQGIDNGETRSVRYRIRQGEDILWTWMGAIGDLSQTPCSAGWMAAAGTKDCQFGGACLGLDGTKIGIRWNALGRSDLPFGVTNSYRITRIRIYQWTPDVSGHISTYGYAWINLRSDETDKGYVIALEGSHGATGSIHFDTFMYEYGGTTDPVTPFYSITLRNSLAISNGIPEVMNENYVFQANIVIDPNNSHRIIVARVNGIVVRTFDLDSDIPEDPAYRVPLSPERIHTTGSVGVGIFDGNIWFNNFPALLIDRYEILCAGAGEPCTGDPNGPDPYPFPPPITEPPAYQIWTYENNAYRRLTAQELKAMMNLGYRTNDILNPIAVMMNLKWRTPDLDTDQLPPPDSEHPPGHDPCGLLPPIIPPDVDVIPITGRFWGVSNMAVTQLDALFTGTAVAQGSWMPSYLAIAAAKGATLIGNQGGYSAWRLNGVFNESFFIDVFLSRFAPLYSVLLDYTGLGVYFGYSLIDDFESRVLWPPNGISHSSLANIVAVAHSEFPGIRFGCRGRPSQFSTNLGFDWYGCQYVSKKHGPAFNFGANEYSLAASRGAFITMDLNFLAGGSGELSTTYGGLGSYGTICSGNEVATFFTAMYNGILSVDPTASKLAGSKGYQWNNLLPGIPGWLNGCAAAHNYMAGLPPL